MDPTVDFDVVSATDTPGRTGEVAEAVDGYNDGFIEGRDIKRRRQVGEMMFDRMECAAKGITWENLSDEVRYVVAVATIFNALKHEVGVWRARQNVCDLSQAVGAVVLIYGYVVDIAKPK